jgi:hypothetical protein
LRLRLDSSLIWIYAIVAQRHPELPEAGRWAAELSHWDPQKALVHLIRAGIIPQASPARETPLESSPEHNPAWQAAMGAAFHSAKLNDYLAEAAQLRRRDG